LFANTSRIVARTRIVADIIEEASSWYAKENIIFVLLSYLLKAFSNTKNPVF
jgi:hypothetical protein